MQTEESICGLAAMVKELKDYKQYFSEEKTRRMMLKQQENERKEQHWNGEINQINQVRDNHHFFLNALYYSWMTKLQAALCST